jgi:putative transcriptional regulator
MDGSLAGRLLVASPWLLDPNFARTVVLLLQHDEDGAVGVVLNRPSAEPVVEHLPEWESRLEEPSLVFVGGPVQPAVAIGVVRSSESLETIAFPGVGIVDLGADPASTPAGPLRVYSGYSGWGPGQLEMELEEGAWTVVAAEADDIFTEQPDDLWSGVLRRQGGRIAMLASFPLDPTLN